MKGKIKLLFMLGVMLVMFVCLGISASAYELYEPDGSSSTVYKYDSSECNREIIITCRDTSGNLLKKVTYHTKHGEDAYITLKIYDYDITAFSSDQGLWETCKLMYTSGGTLMCGEIEIDYYFRTALSTDTLNVSVTMRKMEDIEISEYHCKAIDPSAGYITYHQTFIRDVDVSVDEYVYLGGGYTGYSTRGSYRNTISGYFSYRWLDDVYENIDTSDADWDVIKSADWDERVNYTEFDEDEDGRLTYVKNRKIDVYFYYKQNQYTVYFDANGGGGSVPPSQTQYYGFNVTVGSQTPTRSGYVFRGWGTYSDDTTPNYYPGSTYTMGLSRTLYAVWDDYEFSLTDMNVPQEEIFANSDITLEVRVDNWDRNDAYYSVPVELYFDGTLISTRYVDFEAYGIAYLTYEIDVGTVLGYHTLEARINWNNRGSEVDPTNNNMILEFYTRKDDFGFDIIVLTGNARYTEGTQVMTSFLIYNDSERGVFPSTGADVYFLAYYYDGDETVILSDQVWENFVVPAGESNLVYFRWTVPDNMADVTVYCEGAINMDGALKETVLDNNVATLSTVIAGKQTSQTANPSYSANKPSDYVAASAPTVNAGSASWNMWEYEGGQFVLKRYGIKVNLTDIYISPASTCDTAVHKNGKWQIKSGYGISIFCYPSFESLSGYELPDDYCYTDIQTVYTTFPEYRYLCEDGKYRVLEEVNGAWCFIENEGADGNERLHYIPVWCEDGDYVISVTAMDIWTPAGMITAHINEGVVIDGCMYDNWYQS